MLTAEMDQKFLLDAAVQYIDTLDAGRNSSAALAYLCRCVDEIKGAKCPGCGKRTHAGICDPCKAVETSR